MDAHRVAFNTWQEKTEWVQKDKRFDVLLPWGKHRADVLKEYIDLLESRIADLAVQLANAESKCRELASEVSELNECKNILEKIKSTSCHVDTSPGAFIPNSLDAWGSPVQQYLPYDFSGHPGASATQYCNGWNDAGGYWLNHVKYLQECIRKGAAL